MAPNAAGLHWRARPRSGFGAFSDGKTMERWEDPMEKPWKDPWERSKSLIWIGPPEGDPPMVAP